MAKAHKGGRGKSPVAGKPVKGHVPGTLPTREQVLEFVRTSPDKVGKREIARAFGIKGGDRIALKQLLSGLVEDGALAGNRKEIREKGSMPPVTTLEIIGRDDDGDFIGAPVVWNADDGPRPKVLILPSHNADDDAGRPAGVGDRMLARVTPRRTACACPPRPAQSRTPHT